MGDLFVCVLGFDVVLFFFPRDVGQVEHILLGGFLHMCFRGKMSHVLLGFMVLFDTLPTCSETKTGPKKVLVSGSS